MSQNYLLGCTGLKGLSVLEGGVSTPNKALTIRNFIPQQGNLKLTGFIPRILMRNTDQIRCMVAPSPVICQALKHLEWTVGLQDRELPSVLAILLHCQVAGAYLHHTYTWVQLYQPEPWWDTASQHLQPCWEVHRASLALLGKKVLCSLAAPCLAWLFIPPPAIQEQGQMESEKHWHASAQIRQRPVIWHALQIAKENMTVQTKGFRRGCQQWSD